MIRDFWGISKRRLKDEVDALEEKVDPQTWDAIDSVRKIGNVGAHMEADINVIVDVDPDEATLLISLIETLLADEILAEDRIGSRLARQVTRRLPLSRRDPRRSARGRLGRRVVRRRRTKAWVCRARIPNARRWCAAAKSRLSGRKS